MKLQIHVCAHKAASSAPPLYSFLEIADPEASLDELSASIQRRHDKLYRGRHVLNIEKLQDEDGNDLDLDFCVGDVFSERGVVRVINAPYNRESSIPPDSRLRPFNGMSLGLSHKRPSAFGSSQQRGRPSRLQNQTSYDDEGEEGDHHEVSGSDRQSKRLKVRICIIWHRPDMLTRQNNSLMDHLTTARGKVVYAFEIRNVKTWTRPLPTATQKIQTRQSHTHP